MKALLLISTLTLLAGCSGNPTNAPPEDAVRAANARRAAAIDADPKMTPQDKAKMKQMLGLDGKRPGR